MSVLIDSLKQLKDHVHDLVQVNDKMQRELQQVKAENRKLFSKLQDSEKELETLNHKFESAQIAGQMSNEGKQDNAEMKQTVGLLVREVDRCIALLNE